MPCNNFDFSNEDIVVILGDSGTLLTVESEVKRSCGSFLSVIVA